MPSREAAPAALPAGGTTDKGPARRDAIGYEQRVRGPVRMGDEVRDGGAVPAAVAVVAGELVVGASDDEVASLGRPDRVAKGGARA